MSLDFLSPMVSTTIMVMGVRLRSLGVPTDSSSSVFTKRQVQSKVQQLTCSYQHLSLSQRHQISVTLTKLQDIMTHDLDNTNERRVGDLVMLEPSPNAKVRESKKRLKPNYKKISVHL